MPPRRQFLRRRARFQRSQVVRRRWFDLLRRLLMHHEAASSSVSICLPRPPAIVHNIDRFQTTWNGPLRSLEMCSYHNDVVFRVVFLVEPNVHYFSAWRMKQLYPQHLIAYYNSHLAMNTERVRATSGMFFTNRQCTNAAAAHHPTRGSGPLPPVVATVPNNSPRYQTAQQIEPKQSPVAAQPMAVCNPEPNIASRLVDIDHFSPNIPNHGRGYVRRQEVPNVSEAQITGPIFQIRLDYDGDMDDRADPDSDLDLFENFVNF